MKVYLREKPDTQGVEKAETHLGLTTDGTRNTNSFMTSQLLLRLLAYRILLGRPALASPLGSNASHKHSFMELQPLGKGGLPAPPGHFLGPAGVCMVLTGL